jgi:hypothetical protein
LEILLPSRSSSLKQYQIVNPILHHLLLALSSILQLQLSLVHTNSILGPGVLAEAVWDFLKVDLPWEDS